MKPTHGAARGCLALKGGESARGKRLRAREWLMSALRHAGRTQRQWPGKADATASA